MGRAWVIVGVFAAASFFGCERERPASPVPKPASVELAPSPGDEAAALEDALALSPPGDEAVPSEDDELAPVPGEEGAPPPRGAPEPRPSSLEPVDVDGVGLEDTDLDYDGY